MNEADKPECWPFPCVRFTVNGRCSHTVEPAQPVRGHTPSTYIYDDIIRMSQRVVTGPCERHPEATTLSGLCAMCSRTPSAFMAKHTDLKLEPWQEAILDGLPEPQPMEDVPTKAYVDGPFRLPCGCEWASRADYFRVAEKTRSCTDNAEAAEERRRRDGPAPTATPTAPSAPPGLSESIRRYGFGEVEVDSVKAWPFDSTHEHTAACCHHGYCDCGNDCQVHSPTPHVCETSRCWQECRNKPDFVDTYTNPDIISPARVFCQVRGCDWTATGRNGDLINALTRHLGDKHVTTEKERGVFAAVKRWAYRTFWRFPYW